MARVTNVSPFVYDCLLRAINAYLAATFAHVGFFAGMDACVYSQRGPLDKLLVATGIVADMRSNATVDPFCAQISKKMSNGSS